MTRRSQNCRTICLAASLFVAVGPAASAFEAKLNSFAIQKNGATLLLDTFSDGAPPPSADTELATYLYPRGGLSESSVFLTMTPALDALAQTATGESVRFAGATFSTNIGSNGALGLRSNNTLLVRGLFGLAPLPAIGDGYGIRLTDRNQQGLLDVGTSGDDVIELGVFRQTDGIARVVFRRQDFLGNAITQYSFQTALLNHSQIELSLTKSNSATNAGIEASYRYIRQDGTPTNLFEMAKTDSEGNAIRIFSGEDWTRGEFFAVQAIPEPETYAMLLAGVGLIGWRLRRRNRRANALRIA